MVMLAERPVAAGVQEPRILSVPEFATSLGAEATELAASAGLVLDPWQAFVLEQAMGLRPDGQWSAFEVGLVVSRQNGKGGILEARELAGLFLIGERLQIHSAHQFDTSLEAFRRLLTLVEDTDDLRRQVKRISRSHGEEGIELMNGNRIRFRTRTKGGGRGFSGDALYLDEAMILPEFSHGALLPTLSARPNPQVWYAASAVDQEIHEDGVVLARIRERGHRGADPSLAYFEWSADIRDEEGEPVSPDNLDEDAAADPSIWAEANPGLGIRIDAEHVEYELRAMDSRTFAVERLGVGDWPATDRSGDAVIDFDLWQELTDLNSTPLDPVCFAFDVSPTRATAAIGTAGRRSDGLAHVEVVAQGKGTGWVVDRLVELVEKHQPAAVLCDKASPAASLLGELEARGVTVEAIGATEHGRACGQFYDLVEQKGLRHLGTSQLRAAIKGARTRTLGEAWAWARSKSKADITPLVAVTLALSGALVAKKSWEPMVGVG